MKEMKELMMHVDNLVKLELKMANGKFPPFHSRHEGLSVIQEEFREVLYEGEELEDLVESLSDGVYNDNNNDYMMEICKHTKLCASLMACEAIQVAAMAEKFISLLEREVDGLDPDSFADAKRELILMALRKKVYSLPEDILDTLMILVKEGGAK